MFKNFDWPMFVIIVLLLTISILVVHSSSRTDIPDNPNYFLKKQIINTAVASVLFVIGLLFDYSLWDRWGNLIYAGMIGLLLTVLVIGSVGGLGGGTSWIYIGPLSLQPSEIAKALLVLTLARQMNRMENMDRLWDMVPSFIHMGIPMGLVLLQPDFGTSMVFLSIIMGMLWIYGVKWQHLATLVGAGLAVSPILWSKFDEYQKMRFIVFLNLEKYASTKWGWHTMQSIIAAGSGRLWGKGLYRGSQTQLKFLPERHTDFIFSVLSEELGFVGAALVVILYVALLLRILHLARQAKDRYGMLICVGVASMLAFHLLINVGMTIGVMPITGIPLPLMSYAGSNLMGIMFALGVVMSVGLRRQKILF